MGQEHPSSALWASSPRGRGEELHMRSASCPRPARRDRLSYSVAIEVHVKDACRYAILRSFQLPGTRLGFQTAQPGFIHGTETRSIFRWQYGHCNSRAPSATTIVAEQPSQDSCFSSDSRCPQFSQTVWWAPGRISPNPSCFKSGYDWRRSP